MIKLGVNVDHVATIREARGVAYPSPLEAAMLAVKAGADQITVHLREDRRHIQDADLAPIKDAIGVPLNLEMAACEEIIGIACRLRPATATLVPEKREELTTEGGLDVAGNFRAIRDAVGELSKSGILVSLFVAPDEEQIRASLETGAKAVELHTGSYCDAIDADSASAEMSKLACCSKLSHKLKLKVCAGHGLNYENTRTVVDALPEVEEYNIGHSIVARAVIVGMERAVGEMKTILDS